MDNTALLSRFGVNPKFNTNADLNEINSMLSVSRLSQNNDRPIVIDPNPLMNPNDVKGSAKAYMKFQSNFNIINDMFNNMKKDTNNNENDENDKNQPEKLLPPIDSPQKIDDPEKPEEKGKEKVNDVFINLLKDQKDPLDFSGTFNSTTSFFLHEPKPSAVVPRQRRESGTSFKMLTKDNSFDEGFFDSLNIAKKAVKPVGGKDIVQKWGEAPEEDELASILG